MELDISQVRKYTILLKYSAQQLSSHLLIYGDGISKQESGETLERIEAVIQKIKGVLTEIAIVDYKKTA